MQYFIRTTNLFACFQKVWGGASGINKVGKRDWTRGNPFDPPSISFSVTNKVSWEEEHRETVGWCCKLCEEASSYLTCPGTHLQSAQRLELNISLYFKDPKKDRVNLFRPHLCLKFGKNVALCKICSLALCLGPSSLVPLFSFSARFLFINSHLVFCLRKDWVRTRRCSPCWLVRNVNKHFSVISAWLLCCCSACFSRGQKPKQFFFLIVRKKVSCFEFH